MSDGTLDHVGVVTRDLAALAAQYERLGFLLTPPSLHADGRIGNRCAMLAQGYIELLAVVDPQARSATLERFLARYAGIHIVAIGITDEPAALARLRRAGVDAPSVSVSERSIDKSGAAGARARFALIQTPDQPEGRFNLVRHLTPEALWQERFLRHPNNAAALAEVLIAVAEPADSAARLSRLAGCAVVPDPTGGLALDLRRGRIRLLSAKALADIDVTAPVLPCMIGVTLLTSDANAAIGRLLTERGIAHRRHGEGLLVDPNAAGGVALHFRPSGRDIAPG